MSSFKSVKGSGLRGGGGYRDTKNQIMFLYLFIIPYRNPENMYTEFWYDVVNQPKQEKRITNYKKVECMYCFSTGCPIFYHEFDGGIQPLFYAPPPPLNSLNLQQMYARKINVCMCFPLMESASSLFSLFQFLPYPHPPLTFLLILIFAKHFEKA